MSASRLKTSGSVGRVRNSPDASVLVRSRGALDDVRHGRLADAQVEQGRRDGGVEDVAGVGGCARCRVGQLLKGLHGLLGGDEGAAVCLLEYPGHEGDLVAFRREGPGYILADVGACAEDEDDCVFAGHDDGLGRIWQMVAGGQVVRRTRVSCC
jgi:hypothetical protein